MISAALLLTYAALLGLAAPTALVRARWVTRAPLLAIGLWLALSISWLVSLILSGLVLVRLPQVLRLWLMQVTGTAVGMPGGPVSPVIGAAFTAAVIAWVAYAAVREVRQVRQKRAWHAAVLAFTGRAVPELGVTVVDQDTPAVYCLPGPRHHRRIVATTGALKTLTAAQLDAALAHERAHLRQRHDLLIAALGALSGAFPCVRLLRDAHSEVAILAEMGADDAARRSHDARALAAALVGLARAGAPAVALAAGGHSVVHRLHRILAPQPPLPLSAQAAAASTAACALTLPLALACTALTAVGFVCLQVLF